MTIAANALHAMMNGVWRAITSLAEEYEISRPFVYSLADTLRAEDWKRHFECLYDNGVEATYLVSDEGKGIRAGHAEVMSDVVRQSDTYHAIAHRLGSWAERLEKAAYKAIEVEHECERLLVSARLGNPTARDHVERRGYD